MAEYEEMVRLVDGAYKNILEKFNPCARQLIAAGKTYLKALHAAVAASKGYMDAISRLARHAHQATWGGCTDIGTALMQLVDVQKEIENQQMNVLKAFYVDVIVPLESNIEKDAKVVASEQKRFMQQQKTHHESYLKIASIVKKQRKKSRAGNRGSNVDKEIKQMQSLEEEKGKLDGFCESSLKQAITQERRRFGFVLERQCSLAKHYMAYTAKGHALLQQNVEGWLDIVRTRETLPESISKIFNTVPELRVLEPRRIPAISIISRGRPLKVPMSSEAEREAVLFVDYTSEDMFCFLRRVASGRGSLTALPKYLWLRVGGRRLKRDGIGRQSILSQDMM